MALTEDVSPREVGLEQWKLFHRQSTHLVLVEGSSESFKSRDHAFPRVGGNVIRSGVVRRDDKLHQNISFVAKSQIAQRCFCVTAGGALRDVKRTTNLDKLRG